MDWRRHDRARDYERLLLLPMLQQTVKRDVLGIRVAVHSGTSRIAASCIQVACMITCRTLEGYNNSVCHT
jgi:hypothetical protein